MRLNLKCPYDQILDILFFFIFVHDRSFLDILPNFQLLRTLERLLDLYYREFTTAINFPGSKSWLRTAENDVISSKIPHGLKYNNSQKITRIQEPKCLLFSVAVPIVIIFQPVWYFWENDVIYCRLGTRRINGGRKFSETEVQKPCVLMFVIDWKFGKVSRKDLLCTKI